ncbi:MAG: tRNA glutamyl-Q(34) synthetase GluQRS [Pseudomonadales bacterium]|nr:tRNA glutamyl-Q(34) synthetase GluQRS [Pseudomonadales bacterium]
MTYTGRFAPSPSGPLHRGSLLTAVASFLDARASGGQWLLRIEDTDHQRSRAHYADLIQQTLHTYGLVWDGPVLTQSLRLQTYHDRLDHLAAHHHLYNCSCSRAQLRGHTIYPGNCRQQDEPLRQNQNWRLRAADLELSFSDLLHGPQQYHLPSNCGDIILRRRDGDIAYTLAVVVDDADSAVTHVVRGSDLLSDTAVQIYLQRLLGLPALEYLHIPVLLDTNGRKYSKQNHAPPLSLNNPVPALIDTLTLLGHPPPTSMYGASVQDLLAYTAMHWQRINIPRTLKPFSP